MQTDFDILHAISPGKHYYQFYKSTDDYLSVMIPYFGAGIERGDACLWLISKRHRIPLDNLIIEMIQRYRPETGQFQVLSAEGWYLDKNGDFSEEIALNNAHHYLADVFKNYECLRGSGDVGAIPKKDWDALSVYEANAQSLIKSNPVIALCSYPILECTPSQTKRILELHDDVLVGKF